MELFTLNLLGHLSFFVTSVSFLMKDIILLRSLAIISCVLGIVYNYYVVSNPLWLVIFWLSLFLIINSYQIIKIILDQRTIKLSQRERAIHGNCFGSFSALEFRKLLDIGKWNHTPTGHILTAEGLPVGELRFIYSGEVSVTKENKEITRLKSDSFIGEISYLKGRVATATVKTTKETVYVSWPHKKLRKLLSRNPMMNVSMMTVLNSDLVKKLTD